MKAEVTQRMTFLSSILLIGGPAGLFVDRIINFLFHYYVNTRAYQAAYHALMDQAYKSTAELVLLDQISETADALKKQGIAEDAILKTCLAMARRSAFATAIVRGGINSIHKAAKAVPQKYLVQRSNFIARESDVVTPYVYQDDNIGRAGSIVILRELSRIQARTGAFITTNPGAQVQLQNNRADGYDDGYVTGHGAQRPVFSTYTGDQTRDRHALILEQQDVHDAFVASLNKGTTTDDDGKKLWFWRRWLNRSKRLEEMVNYHKKVFPYHFDYFYTRTTPSHFSNSDVKDRAFQICIGELPLTERWSHRLKRWWTKKTPYEITALNTAPFVERFQPMNDDGTLQSRESYILNLDYTKTMEELFTAQQPAKLPPPPANFEDFAVDSDDQSSGDDAETDGSIHECHSDIEDDFVNPTTTPYTPRVTPSPHSFPVNKSVSKKTKASEPKEATDWQRMIARAGDINLSRGYSVNACYACVEMNHQLGCNNPVTHATSECTLFKQRGARMLHSIHTGCWGCEAETKCEERHTNDAFIMCMAAWSIRNPSQPL